MKRPIFLCAAALSLAHTPALCDLVVVPDDFPTINEALEAIADFDTVLVRAGTYRENLWAYGRAFSLISEEGPGATIVIGGFFVGWDFFDLDYVIRGFTFKESRGIVFNSGLLNDRVVIAHCIIEDNTNDCGNWYAGGISIPSMSDFVVLDSCIVRNNTGCRGGGLSLRGGVVRDCLILGNEAIEGGGGIYMPPGWRLVIQNSTIAGNRITGPGGPSVGAGIEAHGSSLSRLSIDRTIVGRNLGGVGVYGENIPVQPTVTCADVWGNEYGSYGGFPDPTGTNGNISLDPEFCDPETGDYTLRSGSPCAPDNSPPGCGLIGALPVGCGAQAIVDQGASLTKPLLVVRPNPASGSVEFGMCGPVGSAAIEIYSLRGTLVQVLNGRRTPIAWLPGAEIPNGVYFARTSAGDQAVVAKFILVR